MAKNIEVPKQEKRVKRLFIPVTPTEHKNITQYCADRKVTLTDLIRFAIKQTYDL